MAERMKCNDSAKRETQELVLAQCEDSWNVTVDPQL